MHKVFISHASVDQQKARDIANALAELGVDSWASYSDIPPGSHWDRSIESALSHALALIVIVTPASVASDYVRAEVEEAIRSNKIVIPVIAETTDMPLRWRTLQHVSWNPDRAGTCAGAIASALPAGSISLLRELLDDPFRFQEARELILNHEEWLPADEGLGGYIFRTNVETTPDSRIDCLAVRLDSGGPRAILHYLASPYDQPFLASGHPTSQLSELFTIIRKHWAVLTVPLPEQHVLAPVNLLAPQAHRYTVDLRSEWSCYTRVSIYVMAGRRELLSGQPLEVRQNFLAQALFHISSKASCESRIDLLSYDRLLENIESASRSGVDR
jgi:hypothetical protein